MNGVFITGTDTNVGKTFVACKIASELHKKKIKVIPRKPVETGCAININGELFASDADALHKASASTEPLEKIVPFRFQPAISPASAATRSGTHLSLSQLVDACTIEASDSDYLLVEGAGGILSPICNDAVNADLAKKLNLPVLLVVENRLGCINQALMAINAIETKQLNLSAIALNQISKQEPEIYDENYLELQSLTKYPIYKIDSAFKHIEDIISLILT